ncbi:SDR family NAD(P)-dependent oxidoreductase [Kutzneria kofuensis]|uniref:NAD(P)-dependent dehydrogenase (Short-subunit alcohol dehydrogenase family) n=1 Tax=Kutzneria kofuensis TaxID=103725 RepID=A0A7W9KM74_9PSEU|nr:SDR family NAD(P)-dependent oxidoreductase [Kutzneria kofuensis]MBB5895126.1 NAD(P)-dependent dehydrogenase (short-subunit alcohol dehydrogenase family) [Kutzneria kofuensis]
MSAAGKIVVLTGASAGIGAAAARQLHRDGVKVIPVGRNAAKTAAIAEELGEPALTCNYADLDDVRRLADALLERCPRIDVLANNAGGMWVKRELTKDGNELNFQVNCLAPFLLTRLLTDRLRESSGRVINTSTMMVHKHGHIDLDDLDSEHRYKAHDVYTTTKVGAALLLREYARRNPDIETADYHPGIVASEFSRDMKFQRMLLRTPLGKPLQKLLDTPEVAGQRLVYLCETEEKLTGGYYFKNERAEENPVVLDVDNARKLWDLASRRVGLEV